MVKPKVSNSLNGGDLWVSRAFGRSPFTGDEVYADMGAMTRGNPQLRPANTDLVGRVVLCDAKSDLAKRLRQTHPSNSVQEIGAEAKEGELSIY